MIDMQHNKDLEYEAETRRIEAHKLRLQIYGPKVCKFDQGKKNNLVASEYGPEIFEYIEPQGNRLCQSSKRALGESQWVEDLSDKK